MKDIGKVVDAEWRLLLKAIEDIGQFDAEKSERIEIACRVLWDLWDDEDKRQAMGWQSWEDLFHPGNEELAHFFELIEDRITLTSPSNRNRFYNLLMIDADPTMKNLHLLRRRHWTPITQFEGRITRLKSLLNEPDTPEKLEAAKKIVKPVSQEKPDPEPHDELFDFDRSTAYWNNTPALRLKKSTDWEIDKLRSRLILQKTAFVLKRQESSIIATNDQRVVEVATVLLPQSDPRYQDFIEWLSKRLGVKIVG